MTYRSQRCSARRKNGQPCKRFAIAGGTVCPMHGGSASHVRERAAERLRALVYPALETLKELMARADSDSVRLGAARYVLEYAGFRVIEKLETDGQLTVRIIRETPSLDYLAPRPNGHDRVLERQ